MKTSQCKIIFNICLLFGCELEVEENYVNMERLGIHLRWIFPVTRSRLSPSPCTIGRLKGALVTWHAIYFIFMQFSAEILLHNRFLPQTLELAPLVWEILDPPLHTNISAISRDSSENVYGRRPLQQQVVEFRILVRKVQLIQRTIML